MHISKWLALWLLEFNKEISLLFVTFAADHTFIQFYEDRDLLSKLKVSLFPTLSVRLFLFSCVIMPRGHFNFLIALRKEIFRIHHSFLPILISGTFRSGVG